MSSNNPGNKGNNQGSFPGQPVHPVQVFPGQVLPQQQSSQMHPSQVPHAMQASQAHPMQVHTVQSHPERVHPAPPPPHTATQQQHQTESHPATQQQQTTHSAPTPAHGPPSDNDPLVKYQQLLPILKESVVNLIKCTVSILQNISNGSCKQNEMQQLNKCMEDFYNISDQVHHWLVLADTTVGHYLMGSCFSTEVTSSFNTQPTQFTQGDSPKDILLYSQFLLNAKRHVASSSKLRTMLTEFADDLGSGS